MQTTCTKCQHVLQYSGAPPLFCMYCGQALVETLTAATRDQIEKSDPLAATATQGGPGASAVPSLPSSLSGYRLLRLLGSGGMGSVYEAEETATGRNVALKLITPECAKSSEAIERFRQEGRLASLVGHPRCVFVLAVDEEAGRPYIVMERMPGSTLRDLVEKEGPLDAQAAVAKIMDVIEGLQAAHRLDVVHRDVKPSNCFLEPDGRVKIGDFGLAKSLVNDAHLTRSGTFLGTPYFASPEQVRGDPVDPQTDVYSVAATLYYLLTGTPPFKGSDAAATLARIVSEAPPPLRMIRPGIPASLEKVVLRGLERDRKRRFRDLEELRQALLPFLPQQLPKGSLVARVAAYLIDGLLFRLIIDGVVGLVVAAASAGVPPLELTARDKLVDLFGYLAMVLYFAILEGRWGGSLGKRWLRLRVCAAEGAEPPGIPRAFLRACLFGFLLFGGQVLADGWLIDMVTPGMRELPEPQSTIIQVLPWGWLVLGLALMSLTMRTAGGYRGLHEILSGTRTLQLPWPEPRRQLASREGLLLTLIRGRLAQTGGPEQSGIPERVGSFQIRGAIRWSEAEKILLGEDAALGRRVLIWLRPVQEPPLDRKRRDLGRPTRLRWLAHGKQRSLQWDAFLAPAGGPLPLVMAGEERLGWADARPILEELLGELAAACQDGTMPPTLSPDQVWVQPGGRVQLLDTSILSDDHGDEERGEQDQAERSMQLLRKVAILVLEGRPRPAGDKQSMHAPVPLHARRLVDRLAGDGPAYESLAALERDLADTRGGLVEVTRGLRAGQLALLTTVLSIAFLAAGISSLVACLVTRQIMLGLGFSVSLGTPLDPAVCHQAAMASWGVAVGWIVLWIAWAAWWRGGLTLRLMGIAVVRADGRRASPGRCAWRAFLFWLPALGASLIPLIDPGQLDRSYTLETLLVLWTNAWALTSLVMLGYLLLGLLLPRKSIHDWLSGTVLVPY